MSLRTMLGKIAGHDDPSVTLKPEGATHVLFFVPPDFCRPRPSYWTMWGLDFEGEPAILDRGCGVSDEDVAAFAADVLGHPVGLSPRIEIEQRDGSTLPCYYVTPEA